MEFSKEEILQMMNKGHENPKEHTNASNLENMIMKSAIGSIGALVMFVINSQLRINDYVSADKVESIALREQVNRLEISFKESANKWELFQSEPRHTAKDNELSERPIIQQQEINTTAIHKIKQDLNTLSKNDLKLEYRLETVEKSLD